MCVCVCLCVRQSVCGWTDWLSFGQTLFMVGLLLGSLVGGAISDRYGKRPVLLVCVCVHAVCGIVPAVLPQPILFLFIRCLTGVCCCCINICSFSLAVEWTPPAARLWPPAFLPFCFSLGTMAGAPLAWLSPTWRQLHLSLALPQLICLPLYIAIPESPRWLLLKRRRDVLERYQSNSPADKQCLDLVKQHTCTLQLMNKNLRRQHFFSGLSEAPCLLVPLVNLGRRPISMLALFLSGSACFLSLLLSRYNYEPVLVMSLALLGKLCILAANFISVLYSIELFPTVVRQRCVSLVNLCFRIGCLVNSLVPPTPNGAISLAAMVAYSSGPIIGCWLCLLLPETSGISLPDTVEDCDRQRRETETDERETERDREKR
uniref:Si:dkey-190l8.2 n=1 Tax=Labrus bergylta TaxID=56723 RepID=A0A3Q3EPN5_9LABR